MCKVLVLCIPALLVLGHLSTVAEAMGLGDVDPTVKVAGIGARKEDVHYSDGSVELTVDCVERFWVFTGSTDTKVCVVTKDSGFYATYDDMVVINRNAEQVLVGRGQVELPKGTVFAHEMIHALGGNEEEATCYTRSVNGRWVGYQDIDCTGVPATNKPTDKWVAIWLSLNS